MKKTYEAPQLAELGTVSEMTETFFKFDLHSFFKYCFPPPPPCKYS